MPEPSPALARRNAERKARAAEADRGDDDRSETAQLREQLSQLSRELELAKARISELEDDLQTATDSEESVRTLLEGALAELQQLDRGDDASAEAPPPGAEEDAKDDTNDDAEAEDTGRCTTMATRVV